MKQNLTARMALARIVLAIMDELDDGTLLNAREDYMADITISMKDARYVLAMFAKLERQGTQLTRVRALANKNKSGFHEIMGAIRARAEQIVEAQP